MDKITLFFEEAEEEVVFAVLGTIQHNQIVYHMVVEDEAIEMDEDDDDMTAYIIKEVVLEDDEIIYEIVDDDDELEPVITLFEQTLDNYELDVE
jgi:hypothetical protein